MRNGWGSYSSKFLLIPKDIKNPCWKLYNKPFFNRNYMALEMIVLLGNLTMLEYHNNNDPWVSLNLVYIPWNLIDFTVV